MSTVSVSQTFALAFQHHAAGRLGDAEALYRQVLAVEPGHSEAMHHLGVIAHQVGRHGLAMEWIRRAIALNPSNAAAHSNLGEACRAAGRLDEAIARFRGALELQPGSPDIHHNLGNALRDRGDLTDAVDSYRRALALKPEMPATRHNLAATLAALRQLDEALAEYQRALQLQPENSETLNNLGTVLRDLGRVEEGIASLRRALELRPDYPEALNNLGNALRQCGRLEEAVAVYRRALALKPVAGEAWHNLAAALADGDQLDEAVAAYRHALQLKPNYPEAESHMGLALARQGRLDEAMAAHHRVLALTSDYPEVHTNLGNVLRDQGRIWEAVAAHRRAAQVMPDQPAVQSNVIYALHFHPDKNARAIAEEQRTWNRRFGDPVQGASRPHTNDRDPARRLRIGYVSPDFRKHVIGRNLVPLFRCHDRGNFEIVCYSGVMKPDALTNHFRESADRWRQTVGVGDEALAEMIRQDGVDILVDLSQHLAGNRLPVFARQPAPVQVSFAGYPEGTGLDAIPYRISDPWLESEREESRTPRRTQGPWREPGLAESRFSVLSVPSVASTSVGIAPDSDLSTPICEVCFIDSFWCYDPCGFELAVNALPAQTAGTVTFGSMNHFSKVNARALKLWARVLDRVPGSRLMLLSHPGSHRQSVREILGREGVAPERVEFVEPRPHRQYLELHHRLDIVLDPFPYNGHTTSLDALWMGVPVVSLTGSQAVSRAGYSQLSNLGLPELAAFSEDDYVRIAAQLAGDLPRLAELRATLRSRMEASPLMDAPRFARGVEAAYRRMWQQWCASRSSRCP